MLEVTINGELKKVPQCTCGKCIVRRMRKNEDPSIPYPKDLASVYTTDYPPKKPIKDSGFYTDPNYPVLITNIKKHSQEVLQVQ